MLWITKWTVNLTDMVVGTHFTESNMIKWWLYPPSFNSMRKFVLIWPQMTPHDLRLMPKYHKNLPWNGDYTHQVPSPHEKLCFHMNSYDIWMTLDDPENTSKNLPWNGNDTHPVSSPYESLYLYDLKWSLDDLRWTWKYRQRIRLETVTIPTKFQVHIKVYTNMTSDDIAVYEYIHLSRVKWVPLIFFKELLYKLWVSVAYHKLWKIATQYLVDIMNITNKK